MIKLTLAIGLLLAVSLNSMGQKDVWSLQRCIDYAIKNNVQVKQGMVATQYQQNLLKQSKYARLPNLNGQASQSFNSGTNPVYPGNTYEKNNSSTTTLNFSTSVPVFQGFMIKNNISMNQLNLQASLQDLEKAKSDISMNIAATYLAILFDKDLIKVSQDQLDVTNQTINQTQQKVEAGSLAKGSLLEIQAQAAGEQLNVVNAVNQLKLDKLKLTQLLEIQASDSFDIETPVLPEILSQVSVNPASDVFKKALDFRPEILGADYRVQSSQYQLKSAHGLLYPTISAFANFSDRYYRDNIGTNVDFGTQVFTGNPSKGIGLQMNIPIFTRLQNKTSIANARLQVLTNQLNLEAAKKTLRSDIETAQTNAIAALNRYESNQTAVASMQEAFRYAEEKFNVGMVNTVEYNTAKTNLSKAESDLLQAKYEFIFRSKILDFYQGTPITL
jgi:outer membrane protein